jgi:hypothetical protein
MKSACVLFTTSTSSPWFLTANRTMTTDPGQAWAAERWRLEHEARRLRGLPVEIKPASHIRPGEGSDHAEI